MTVHVHLSRQIADFVTLQARPVASQFSIVIHIPGNRVPAAMFPSSHDAPLRHGNVAAVPSFLAAGRTTPRAEFGTILNQ